MNLSLKRLDGRLKELEQLESTRRDVVLLVYADGKTKRVIEDVGTIANEIENYFGWCSFYEGMSGEQPELVEIKNITQNTIWNLKTSAEQSVNNPMTDAEADRICKEIEMEVLKSDYKY